MGELDGRVAIVTGSSSGIGEAVAHHLADAGASVVVNSSSSVDAGEAVAAALSTESSYVQADISDQAQCVAMIDATLRHYSTGANAMVIRETASWYCRQQYWSALQ